MVCRPHKDGDLPTPATDLYIGTRRLAVVRVVALVDVIFTLARGKPTDSITSQIFHYLWAGLVYGPVLPVIVHRPTRGLFEEFRAARVNLGWAVGSHEGNRW